MTSTFCVIVLVPASQSA